MGSNFSIAAGATRGKSDQSKDGFPDPEAGSNYFRSFDFCIPFPQVQPLSGLPKSESIFISFPPVAPGAIQRFDHFVVISLDFDAFRIPDPDRGQTFQ